MSKLTAEQAEIVTSKSRKLVVAARAGSGKTYTLVEYARQNPRVRMLYLAYNRAIRDEAVSKFPVNVDCKTSHQLAFFSCGKPLAGKLSANLRLRDIATAAQSNNWTFARDVLDTLNAFMSSESDALCAEHFTRLDDNKNASSKVVRYQMEVVDWAAQLWERMIDPNDKFPATHDTYLKLFQLSQPRLSERYGAILFDEAQDSNPVTSAIVLNQSCTLVIVGDPHQQIYRFRGANDAMSHPLLADADRMYLTHSFRFGPQVAFVANALLELKGETRPVVGQGGADEVLSSMAYETSERHTAYINRTVMGVIADAIRSASHGLKTYWVGGIEGYNITTCWTYTTCLAERRARSAISASSRNTGTMGITAPWPRLRATWKCCGPSRSWTHTATSRRASTSCTNSRSRMKWRPASQSQQPTAPRAWNGMMCCCAMISLTS
ncbi:ATP-dependent helicase [Diaphorobacter sp. DS2]|nr:ATP-dependent helicase [Diaphorobacter sp. DS2]